MFYASNLEPWKPAGFLRVFLQCVRVPGENLHFVLLFPSCFRSQCCCGWAIEQLSSFLIDDQVDLSCPASDGFHHEGECLVMWNRRDMVVLLAGPLGSDSEATLMLVQDLTHPVSCICVLGFFLSYSRVLGALLAGPLSSDPKDTSVCCIMPFFS